MGQVDLMYRGRAVWKDHDHVKGFLAFLGSLGPGKGTSLLLIMCICRVT